MPISVTNAHLGVAELEDFSNFRLVVFSLETNIGLPEVSSVKLDSNNNNNIVLPESSRFMYSRVLPIGAGEEKEYSIDPTVGPDR